MVLINQDSIAYYDWLSNILANNQSKIPAISNDAHGRPRLAEIVAPVKDDISAFEKQFKSLLKSDVFLVDKVVSYLISQRGKRIRPLMVLLVSRLTPDAPSHKRLNAAAIVELMHTASLVHDDVVDGSYKRRGFPSLNAIWKNKISVLTGDYLFSKVLTAMTNIHDFAVFDIISSTAERMSQGELLQMERSKDFWMDEKVYFKLIGDKTASLISAACSLGAIAAGMPRSEVEMMGGFGENIGLAFQIKDDLLDLMGIESKLGKPVGNDIRENKITLPLLHALKQAEKRDAKKIIRLVKSGEKAKKEDYKNIINFIKENDGVNYASQKADNLISDSIEKLSHYEDSIYKDVLIKLVRFVTSRDY